MRQFVVENTTAVLLLFFAVYLLISVLVQRLRRPLDTPEANTNRIRSIKRHFVVGLGFLILALVYYFTGIANHRPGRWPQTETWEVVASDDGAVSIEMPATPVKNVQPQMTPAGPTDVYTHTVSLDAGRRQFILSYSRPTGPSNRAADDEQLQTLRDNLAPFMQQKTGKPVALVREYRLNQSGCKGIGLEHRSGSYTVLLQVFIVAGWNYSAMVQVLSDEKDTADIRRFFDTFKIIKKDG